MITRAVFTLDLDPVTGLSPLITITKISDLSVVVDEDTMTEIGGGWYFYEYDEEDGETYIEFVDADTDLVDDRYPSPIGEYLLVGGTIEMSVSSEIEAEVPDTIEIEIVDPPELEINTTIEMEI